MFDTRKVGKKIAALRKERNKTQMELADEMGVSYQAVSNWERGNSMPDISKLPQLSLILGTSVDEILGESKEAQLLEHVIAGTEQTFLKEQETEVETIAGVAPLMKPEQTKKLVEHVVESKEEQGEDGFKGEKKKISVKELTILAPYLEENYLEELVEKGEFREDLYYRLNVIPIWLPPLRERREDIPVLAEHFLNKIAADLNREPKYLTPEAMEAILRYSWPGNIRELENVMERVNILADRAQVGRKDLPHYISENYTGGSYEKHGFAYGNSRAENAAAGEGRISPQNSLSLPGDMGWEAQELHPWEYYEKEIIRRALETYGSFNGAGKALGLTHKTVASKARKYQLETKR